MQYIGLMTMLSCVETSAISFDISNCVNESNFKVNANILLTKLELTQKFLFINFLWTALIPCKFCHSSFTIFSTHHTNSSSHMTTFKL